MTAEDDARPVIGYTGARFGGASRRKARKRAAKTDAAGGKVVRPDHQHRDTATEVIPVPAPAPEPAVESVGDRPGDAAGGRVVGYTGARFAGTPRPARTATSPPSIEPAEQVPGPGAARRFEPALESVTGTPGEVDAGDGPVVGYTGARFRGAPRRRRTAAPPPSNQPADQVSARVETPAPSMPPPPLPGVEAAEPVDQSGSSFVRPYVFTRGRTRPQFELSVEALLSAVPTPARRSALDGDHEAVLALCREPRSVAELAALLGVPLGVARVLVGDLAAAGAVAVHRAAGAAGPDLALMERVLSGLRRL